MSSPSGSSVSNPGRNPFAAEPVSVATVQMLPIRHHVPVILDLEDSTYTTWHTYFMVTFRKLGLLDHIDGSLDAKIMEVDVHWTQIDQCIVFWLYTTVSQDVLNIILQPSDTAVHVWDSINALFIDSRLQRAVYAKQEFHNLVQGELSIMAYCSRLKCLADTLRDVGSPVSDHDLLVNLIRGLNDDFGHCIAALTFRPEGLTFAKARNSLLLEEPAAGGPLHCQTCAPAGSTPAPPTLGASRSRKKKKNKGLPGGSQIVPRPAAPPGLPNYTQLAGMFQAWLAHSRAPNGAPSGGAGIFGARPASPAPGVHQPNHAGFSALAPPPVHSAPYQQGWDPTPLQAALANMNLQYYSGGALPPPGNYNSGGNWILDTGATSHMANDPGSSHPGSDYPM